MKLLNVLARSTLQMKRHLAWVLLLLAQLILAQPLFAQTLVNVEATALPGDKTELNFIFTEPAKEPRVYVIDSPARLVVDFWGATKGDLGRTLPIGSGAIGNLQFAEVDDRTRVVVELTESLPYAVNVDGVNVRLQLGAEGSKVAGAAQATPATANTTTQTSDITRIVGVDFERVEGGQGRVTISMSDDRAGLDIVEEGSGIIVNLSGANIAAGLAQRLDVQAFATPVNFIDSMNAEQNAAILILPSKDPYEYLAYQSGNQLVLDFKPVSLMDQTQRQADLFPYTGQEIDLNFQNVELRSVLQIIAEVAEKNLVVGEEVGGNTTLRLKNVPWDQALDIILKTNGLDKRVVGNVMLVGDATQIADRERKELENQQAVKELAPLNTEYVQIDYRRASEMKEYLATANMISERGFIMADDQTNVLMVRETQAAIEDIRRTLKRFDVEAAQVMIEARIVSVSKTFTEKLGINWGFANGPTKVFGDGQLTFGTQDVAQSGLNVDLGVVGPSLAVGFIKNSLLLTAELSALETAGDGEVISQPRVITTNGKVASITSGTQVSVPASKDENGKVTYEPQDVVLGLQVTPQLNPNDKVLLDLAINQDSVTGYTPDGETPLIGTNKLSTSVVVSDGDTIVLGGVFRTEKTDDVSKVPFFGDLPVFGAAFRNSIVEDRKTELLIFITPKLIRESLSVR